MKKILLTLLSITVCFLATAQDNDLKRISVGVESSLLRGTSPNIELKGYSPVSLYGGYNINSHLFVGAGLGFTSYYGTLLIPVAAKVRWVPFDWKLSPYLSCDVGYNMLGGTTLYEPTDDGTIPYNPDIRDGFLFKPEMGVALRISPSSELCFGMGIYLQAGEFDFYEQRNGDIVYNEQYFVGVLSFKLGYRFSF